jgi:hypothetical protein
VTKEEWAEIEKKLCWTGASVSLDCDGYRLGVYRERYKKMRDCLMVYVNGKWDWNWCWKDCEERRRFCQPVKKYLWKPKERAEMKACHRRMGKRTLQELRERLGYKPMDPDAAFTLYQPIWANVSALRRHLMKNNKEIKLYVQKGDSGDCGGSSSS